MKKLIFLTLFLAIYCNVYSQNFSYSFEGQLDSQQISNIESRCLNLDQIDQAKVKYKEEAQRGEIVINIRKNENQRAESGDQFKASSLKQLMIELGLSPIEFRKLND